MFDNFGFHNPDLAGWPKWENQDQFKQLFFLFLRGVHSGDLRVLANWPLSYWIYKAMDGKRWKLMVISVFHEIFNYQMVQNWSNTDLSMIDPLANHSKTGRMIKPREGPGISWQSPLISTQWIFSLVFQNLMPSSHCLESRKPLRLVKVPTEMFT